ncbi:mycothiol transferase [Actinoplanes sp. HUAS TT8]|uniref:mycothiol transferase n=1 Tax=Actinoplanes sp. HUAS TT8 TaxID=3447453 RepID=UPI003F51E5A6
MDAKGVLEEAFGRVPDLIDTAIGGLSPEQLHWAPKPGANSIGWLIWHLTRVHDHHVAELMGSEQIYVGGDWAGRFGLKPDPSETGYAHTAADVAAVVPESAAALTEYYRAVHERTVNFVRGLTEAELDRIVDRRWDPPVTMGVRLVSVYDDCAQHAGQAAYVRGLLP